MTIAAGFLCTDGIVLASDTLHSGINKRYAAKTWMAVRRDLVVAAAGSGVTVLLQRFEEDVRHELRASMSLRDVRDVIDNKLYAIFHKHKANRDPDEAPPITVIVGVRAEGKCRLYESDGAAMVGPVVKKRACIGWGAALGLYYADFLFRKEMTMDGGAIIAAHLIRQTKRYGHGCGGRTQILNVPIAGQPVKLRHDKIAELEKYFAQVEAAFISRLPVTPLPNPTLQLGMPDPVTAAGRVNMAAFLSVSQPQPPYALRQSAMVAGDWISGAIASGAIPLKPDKSD